MATSTGFSSALRLTDLDDFIGPSQECIKPVQTNKVPAVSTSGSVKIHKDGSYVQMNERGEEVKLEKAQITLNDCLACSGCVTSAETILITQQSHTEFFRVLDARKSGDKDYAGMVVVVSISPQSRASLAVKFKVTAEEMADRLISFFKHLGVDSVFDTTFSRDFALIESANEFIDRFKTSSSVKGSIPMLASACPGWICYAEKTHGSFILPHISSTKSPQQIMGSLVKHHYSQSINTSPDNIYHVTVMPCYDKKLEASRQDFYDDIYRTRDVDCVITTDEVLKMVEEKGIDLMSLPITGSFTEQIYTSTNGHQLLSHSGGGSGGYLEYIYKMAAKELFGINVDAIEYKVLRNKDFKECTLEVDGKVLLKFAAAYGFRNIQNLVQKMKRGRCPYHFVEVMACPSGCVNGGGQIKPDIPNSVTESKELVAKVDTVYNSLHKRLPEDNESVMKLYLEWLEGKDTVKSKQMLHTQYHAVEKFVSALNIKW